MVANGPNSWSELNISATDTSDVLENVTKWSYGGLITSTTTSGHSGHPTWWMVCFAVFIVNYSLVVVPIILIEQCRDRKKMLIDHDYEVRLRREVLRRKKVSIRPVKPEGHATHKNKAAAVKPKLVGLATKAAPVGKKEMVGKKEVVRKEEVVGKKEMVRKEEVVGKKEVVGKTEAVGKKKVTGKTEVVVKKSGKTAK